MRRMRLAAGADQVKDVSAGLAVEAGAAAGVAVGAGASDDGRGQGCPVEVLCRLDVDLAVREGERGRNLSDVRAGVGFDCGDVAAADLAAGGAQELLGDGEQVPRRSWCTCVPPGRLAPCRRCWRRR